MITLHTDGACQGNPGLGGYAAILQHGTHRKELIGAYEKTTNNRMELMAVIVGLEAIKKENQQVVIYTDSRYIVDAMNKGWLKNWLKKGFKIGKKGEKTRKNKDLWLRFWAVYQQHQVTLNWLQGHAGHVENERCDFLAVQAATKGPWLKDHGYITNQPSVQLKLS